MEADKYQPNENKRFIVNITGIVQGVGFRPFIYKLANESNIKGSVKNTSKGVLLDIEGKDIIIDEFLHKVKNDLPPLGFIKEIQIMEDVFIGYSNFIIEQSTTEKTKFSLISPDVAICEECLFELKESSERRYRYPFINCTNCGPRFSIINDIPYDRSKTTMAKFDLCSECFKEYNNPLDRRFHAQPNACEACGPRLGLKDKQWQDMGFNEDKESANPDYDKISLAVKLLKDGKILAVKGLGGYHLVCNGKNNDSVSKLRNRKIREDKPFAVMGKDLKVIKEQVFVNEKEEEILTGFRKPIVLLKKRQEFNLAVEVAPGNNFLGVMLPYTPLHYLLLNNDPEVNILVMTSGNRSSEPIVYMDDDARKVLGDIADYFLVHNREIYRRVDDSVTRVWRSKEYIIRRARGYAPYPIIVDIPIEGNILACGGEQKNVFCLNQGQYFFLSHHIGDLENLETLESFEEGIEDFKKLFNINPELVTYDLHPEYLSTQYALELDLPKVPVQHHHAHVVSCMVANGLKEEVLGIVFDGTGCGTDSNLWGGEFLIADFKYFRRYAHLNYSPLPGGAKAIKEPWRMAIAYLLDAFGEDFILAKELDFFEDIKNVDLKLLVEATKKGINAPLTSSVGRLFDGIAAILNIRTVANYEGQGAIELEQLAYDGYNKLANERISHYKWDMRDDVIDITDMIKDIVLDYRRGVSKEYIAYCFHITIADIITKISKKVRKEIGINKVCLSGGVFQNMLLLDLAYDELIANKFEVFLHGQVPTNDGGIALGQAIIAHERSASECV